MNYRTVKCWFCGQIPHPLDNGHSVWCSRIWRDTRSARLDGGQEGVESNG